MRTKEEIESLLEEDRRKPIEDDQYYLGVNYGWRGALEWVLEDEPRKIERLLSRIRFSGNDFPGDNKYTVSQRAAELWDKVNEIIDVINEGVV